MLLAKKRPTKQEQYYKGLQDTIYPMVSIRLNNVSDIQKEVEKYVCTQKHIKRLNKQLMSNELLIYIIGERFIEVILDALKAKVQEDINFNLEYQDFEDYVFRKIHSIGLFEIIIPSPEQIPMKLIMEKRNYMKHEFEKIFLLKKIEEE